MENLDEQLDNQKQYVIIMSNFRNYLQERLLVVISKGVVGGGKLILYFLVNGRNLVTTNISLSASY